MPRSEMDEDDVRDLEHANDQLRAERERLRAELSRAQALSSGDPAAVAELRAENEQLRAVFDRAREVAQRPVGTWSGPEAAHYILGDWTPL